ncbi:MAG: peptide-methionine (S)-S-oxide reductase [Novosphingobium sp. 28-62-57]|uniref:peptide-methionine (S)-S-oxide reductase MsrA n=1 Tax=unclassified Novosphingobium TaxID=2644732 RepID=UPI000BCF7803|nr:MULTISPECIES: peptide-methionine (S)-S-oxide reductase MsrA [unclassified Novosphingobium]OYW50278.1 MAG: peptide-methionine (S)-S-oxide reductase [Novosphingobium sp. 12-62-10]OYZ11617.1 MAG: peptide-methionine (S)-S-oxide reductase [Novosphingobium sp. 28-62-57]OZA35362.1 MAG: peptide-methionine (S)-S-oxide reductase [Novosphingobium sp. 17-62-9]
MRRPVLTLMVALGIGTAACQQPAIAQETMATPAAAVEARETPGKKVAIFAGGCFWGIEAVFSHLKGVSSVVSGYHGGEKKTAAYELIDSGKTGHAESVRVTYDPAVIRYDQLLRVFFAVGANPTQLNYQGPDHGTQYRNALVPLSIEQKAVAAGYLAQLKRLDLWKQPIVTAVEPYKAFYPAEDYHQDFAAKNPDHGYIRRWDAPKVRALKAMFPDLYKTAFTRN